MASPTINNVTVTITQPPVIQATVGVATSTNPQITGVGVKGDKGEQGEKGDQGEQGIQGEQGERGDPGTLIITGGVNGNLVSINASEEAVDSGVAPSDFAPALGADDNYVTDAEKTKLSNLSGTNTGDQDVSGAISTHASDTATHGATGAVVGTTNTQTLTNKRITKREVTATNYTTSVTLDSDAYDIATITAQAGALLFNNPSGTPTQGQTLIIRIKDNGTARALTYGSEFRAMGTTLPTTTVLSKTLYMLFMRNTTDAKWDLLAANQEA